MAVDVVASPAMAVMSGAVPENAPPSVLRNCTFDELKVGDSASLVRIVGRDDIDLFAAVSGDVNPAHLDATFAATDLFGPVVAHGMWTRWRWQRLSLLKRFLNVWSRKPKFWDTQNPNRGRF